MIIENTENLTSGFKIKLPKVKIPTISIPKISLPEISIPKISLPEVSMPSIPEIKLPELNTPSLDELGRMTQNVINDPAFQIATQATIAGLGMSLGIPPSATLPMTNAVLQVAGGKADPLSAIMTVAGAAMGTQMPADQQGLYAEAMAQLPAEYSQYQQYFTQIAGQLAEYQTALEKGAGGGNLLIDIQNAVQGKLNGNTSELEDLSDSSNGIDINVLLKTMWKAK
ncbi:MAG: hypothetical protein JW917_00880 [Ignavibacteria bacterium]|nr:hypothetical protein [Ignavibacteria bacterium]